MSLNTNKGDFVSGLSYKTTCICIPTFISLYKDWTSVDNSTVCSSICWRRCKLVDICSFSDFSSFVLLFRHWICSCWSCISLRFNSILLETEQKHMGWYRKHCYYRLSSYSVKNSEAEMQWAPTCNKGALLVIPTQSQGRHNRERAQLIRLYDSRSVAQVKETEKWHLERRGRMNACGAALTSLWGVSQHSLPVSTLCCFSCFSWLTCWTVRSKSTPCSLAACCAIFLSTSFSSILRTEQLFIRDLLHYHDSNPFKAKFNRIKSEIKVWYFK